MSLSECMLDDYSEGFWSRSCTTNTATTKSRSCQRLLQIGSQHRTSFAPNQGEYVGNPAVGWHGDFTRSRRTARWTMVKTRSHTPISEPSSLGLGWPRGAGGKKQPIRPMLVIQFAYGKASLRAPSRSIAVTIVIIIAINIITAIIIIAAATIAAPLPLLLLQNETRPDTRRDEARTRPTATRQDETRHDETRQETARDETR